MKGTMTEAQFNARALRAARARRSLSLADLGAAVGTHRTFVHHLESGLKQPTPLMAAALAEALQVEPHFFYRRLPEVTDELCHFRRRAKTSVAVRNMVLANGAVFETIVEYIAEALDLPSITIPQLIARSPEDIENAADRCRIGWGLRVDAPISNMVRVMENFGAVVACIDEATHAVDAFSWWGCRPIVVKSTSKESASRDRFDIAHELGHLVMHRDVVTGEPDTEQQANRFASAFLMPRTGFVREFPRTNERFNWDALLAMKDRWKVSVQAILHRAFDLRLIDARRYRAGCIHINKVGWRKAEPREPQVERPELVPTALERLRMRGVQPATLAMSIGLRLDDFASITGMKLEETSQKAYTSTEGLVLPLRVRPRITDDELAT